MKITNNTCFPVIAFGWHSKKGYGDDVLINAGSVAEVNGPYVGEMGGGSCYVHLTGAIICQETPDDEHGFQIGIGLPIIIELRDGGINIRHHSDEAEGYVVKWRNSIIKRN